MDAEKKSALTEKFLVTAILGIGAFEIWTLFNKRESDTISEEVWSITPERPLIPFLCGLLMGHFFWQKKEIVHDAATVINVAAPAPTQAPPDKL